jgi:hypothetical protein
VLPIGLLRHGQTNCQINGQLAAVVLLLVAALPIGLRRQGLINGLINGQLAVLFLVAARQMAIVTAKKTAMARVTNDKWVSNCIGKMNGNKM